MNQSDWDLLILQYLKEQGYTEAQAALEGKLGVAPDAGPGTMALSDRLALHKGVVSQLLASFKTSDQPAAYVEALDRFAAWLDNTLDQYRGELSRMLYPLLLHTHLALVSRDAGGQAAALLAKYKRRLVQVDGPLSRSRAAELQELAGVAVKQHMDSSNVARKLLSGRQVVRLSPYAKELLLHFLHCNPGLLCLASLVSQYITLEVSEGGEAAVADAAVGAGLDAAGSGDTIGPNAQPLALGLLQGNMEDVFREQAEARSQEEQAVAKAGGSGVAAPPSASAGGEAGPSVGGDPKPDGAAPAAAGATGADAGGAGGAGAASAPAKKSKKADAKAGGDAAPVWRIHPGERVEPHAWTPQLSEAVQQSWLKDIQARDPVDATALPSCCFFTFANTRQTMSCAAFAHNAAHLAAGFADSSVRLYDVAAIGAGNAAAGRAGASRGGGADGGASESDSGRDGRSGHGVTYLCGHTGPVHALGFTADLRLLLSAAGDGTVRLWSPDLGAGLAVLRGHLLPVWDVAAAPHGYHLATASADKTARVWATDNVRALRILSGHQSDVDVVRWHPNCHYVATASSDRTVRLWDVATGAAVRHMKGLQAAPTSMAMHPDGRHVAVGCERGTISVWDLGSAKRVTSFKAHLGPVWSLAYSLGLGALLASGGADETVRVWGLQTLTSPGAEAAAGAGLPAQPDSVSHGAYRQVVSSHTKSSNVVHVAFSNRNLLLAAGAFQLKAAAQRKAVAG